MGRSFAARLAALAIILAAAAGPGASGAKAAQSVFAVGGVKVDVKAETAAAARKQAIARARKEAFGRLVARLVPADDRDMVKTPGNSRLKDLVQNFEVSRENASAGRYIGTLTVRFQPDATRQYLRRTGAAFAETQSDPVLILPVFETKDGKLRLWDDPNPWRAVWNRRPLGRGLVPLTLPLGDLDDVTALDAGTAVDGAWPDLEPLARRYDAARVLVARAAAEADPVRGTTSLTLTAWRVGPDQGRRRIAERTWSAEDAETGEGLEPLLRQAADALNDQIEGRWKEQNLLQFGKERSLWALVPVPGGLKDWLAVRRGLRDAAPVRRVETASLTRRDALVAVHFMGDEDQLRTALEQKDLVLRWDVDGWVIHRAGADVDLGSDNREDG